jgi:hypothetical protein
LHRVCNINRETRWKDLKQPLSLLTINSRIININVVPLGDTISIKNLTSVEKTIAVLSAYEKPVIISRTIGILTSKRINFHPPSVAFDVSSTAVKFLMQ